MFLVRISDAKMIYSIATGIMEMLGLLKNKINGKQEASWRRRLEAKIKAARREVSQLSEAQKGTARKVPKRYSQMPIPEGLKSAKQRLQALAARLKTYTGENNPKKSTS